MAVGIRRVVEEIHKRKKPLQSPAGRIDRVRMPPKPLPPPKGPVALPAIWNVPHNRNPHFTGREDVLAKLHEALQPGGSAALTQAITGLGGVGKTQTAIEYAYRCAGEYGLVWWVRSEEPAKLATDYARLAKHFGIAEERELKLTVEAVKAELARRERWLLVFDNANHADEVRDYLPQGGQGAVLITSRDQNWSEVADTLGITTWPRADSVKFLLDRTRQTDSAAAYCGEMAKSLGDYLRLLRERTREVLRSGKAPAGYHATVTTTWELAFAEVEKKSEAAGQLLNLCAFLAPDDIGREMLRGGAEFLPSQLKEVVADDLQWDDAVGALRAYSLVEVKAEAISVHRLVQAVVRDRLDEEGKKKWAGVAVKVVNSAFPFDSDDVRTWANCARLLPHALTAAGNEEALNGGLEACGLLNQAGLYLRGRAEFSSAKALHERALKIDEATHGPDHADVAIDLNNLGLVLKDLGDLQGARAHHERALKIGEATYGKDQAQVAIYVNNLGNVSQRLGGPEGSAGSVRTSGEDWRGLVRERSCTGSNLPEQSWACSQRLGGPEGSTGLLRTGAEN